MNLASRLHGHVTVVGVGNPLRGDDGVGCRIARALEDAEHRGVLTHPGGVTVVNAEEVPENFLGPLVESHPDVVLFVDAVDLGAPAGSSAIVEPDDLDDTGPFTHRTPLGLTASLLQRMTGADVFLLAVQPAALEWGAPLSPSVATTADNLTILLREALS